MAPVDPLAVVLGALDARAVRRRAAARPLLAAVRRDVPRLEADAVARGRDPERARRRSQMLEAANAHAPAPRCGGDHGGGHRGRACARTSSRRSGDGAGPDRRLRRPRAGAGARARGRPATRCAGRRATRPAAAAIEAAGAEPYLGDPDRIGTLMERAAGVTIVVLADGARPTIRAPRRPVADAVREAGRHAGARRGLRRRGPCATGRGGRARPRRRPTGRSRCGCSAPPARATRSRAAVDGAASGS